ncbi:TRAP transporter small permease [Leisingera thetidis]|uniref:TRAP transporter small permease n=1 Tax=Leisingera thetidis TaxID=2930199 RepID=UPI0021F7F47C|nr:TRAP transporter small permease subunit [Leisingera thetidis]
MTQFFSILDRTVARLSDIFVLITSAMVVGLVFFLVIARYVLEMSIVGIDEIALVAAIWLYMVGAIVASRRAEHLVVDFLPQRLASPRLLKLHQRVVALIMTGATIFFISLAWDMMGFAIKRPQETPGLGIPELIALSAVALASVVCFAYAIRDLVTGKACHNPKEPEEL